ncbi:hypothetical protein ACTTAM_17020 [Rhodobacter capsulatus]|uniref:hypothetical protein n=1 Tax=Rhodobacter capsulatus TaxID=1061 RepID=UPI00402949A2
MSVPSATTPPGRIRAPVSPRGSTAISEMPCNRAASASSAASPSVEWQATPVERSRSRSTIRPMSVRLAVGTTRAA